MSNIFKFIGALLVFYSIAVGMLIPLGTGIYYVNPARATTGEPLKLTVKAYNGNYQESKGIEARLRLNKEQAICARKIEVKSNKELRLHFNIPAGKLPLKAKSAEGAKSPFPLLEINDPKSGHSMLESAIFIKNNGEVAVNKNQLCEVSPYQIKEKLTFPYLNILQETIRNLYFHVPMWFGMMFILLMSVMNSIIYLSKPTQVIYDIKANAYAKVGILFGLIGIVTGALWAKHTWGAYWSFDVKQNMSAVALMIYLAYFVLRSSFDDMDKKARIAAIYNIFAFAALIPLLYVIPRMVDSLHPGATGNPGFNTYDLDSTMRMVFYPAVIGWIMMGFWLADVSIRIEKLQYKQLEKEWE